MSLSRDFKFPLLTRMVLQRHPHFTQPILCHQVLGYRAASGSRHYNCSIVVEGGCDGGWGRSVRNQSSRASVQHRTYLVLKYLTLACFARKEMKQPTVYYCTPKELRERTAEKLF